MTVGVLWLFLTAPWVGLQYLIMVFPDQFDQMLFKLTCKNFETHIYELRCMKHYVLSVCAEAVLTHKYMLSYSAYKMVILCFTS